MCLSNNNIYTFRIELYKKLFDIINSIDTFISIETQEMLIANEDKNTLSALIIKTNIASFMLSGLLGDDYEEEERVLLSEKLEKSRPFFDFKAPINFEWNKLVGDKDRQFERICELLLQKEKNISRIIPIGKLEHQIEEETSKFMKKLSLLEMERKKMVSPMQIFRE